MLYQMIAKVIDIYYSGGQDQKMYCTQNKSQIMHNFDYIKAYYSVTKYAPSFKFNGYASFTVISCIYNKGQQGSRYRRLGIFRG